MTDTKPMPERTDEDECSCGDETSVFINPEYVLALEADYRVLRAAVAEYARYGDRSRQAALVNALAATHDIQEAT